jgi:hypothetical protein
MTEDEKLITDGTRVQWALLQGALRATFGLLVALIIVG